MVAEGGGKNILASPALCLAELASAASRQKYAEPLAAGEIITTGSMTDAQPIAANQTWTATLEGLPLPPLTLRTTP
jgi:2-oxo-3-hexenedioate decarboxylase